MWWHCKQLREMERCNLYKCHGLQNLGRRASLMYERIGARILLQLRSNKAWVNICSHLCYTSHLRQSWSWSFSSSNFELHMRHHHNFLYLVRLEKGRKSREPLWKIDCCYFTNWWLNSSRPCIRSPNLRQINKHFLVCPAIFNYMSVHSFLQILLSPFFFLVFFLHLNIQIAQPPKQPIIILSFTTIPTTMLYDALCPWYLIA